MARKVFHLAYEILRLRCVKMSSCETSAVFYDDFYDEALRRARDSVDCKHSEDQSSDLPDLDKERRREVAEAAQCFAAFYRGCPVKRPPMTSEPGWG